MARVRTTLDVREIVAHINDCIAHTESREARKAQATLAEHILMRANAYKGFRYLSSEWDENGLKENYDDSKVFYFLTALPNKES